MALPSSPAETGRANRKTVLALKARAALYAASPLFNPTDKFIKFSILSILASSI